MIPVLPDLCIREGSDDESSSRIEYTAVNPASMHQMFISGGHGRLGKTRTSLVYHADDHG